MCTVRKLRKTRGWSRGRLANEAGVTYAAVRKWETRGTKGMQLGVAVRVADALGVDVHDLLDVREVTPSGRGCESR